VAEKESDQCHCGKPLHYTDNRVKSFIQRMIKDCGEYIVVTLMGGTSYRVPRHYIALHGIRGSDLDRLGFEKISLTK